MRLIFLLMAASGCQQIESWQQQIDAAQSDVDKDGDGVAESDGDCEESCDNQLLSPDGESVCRGWFFHPMDSWELEKLFLGGGGDQDCNGVADVEQPGLDFDHDDYVGIPEMPGEIKDCDDFNGSVRPGAYETCGDNVDQDCDGSDAVCGEE